MSTDLKPFSLLVEFTEEDREALWELLEERSVMAGRSIFREGSEADGLFLIVSGEVTLSARRAAEPETMGAGESLGTLSLIAVGLRESTAVAASACQVLFLPRTSFRRLVDDYPRTACRLVEAILRELVGTVRPCLDAVATSPRA